MNPKLVKYLSDFCKIGNTQYAHLKMIETRDFILNKGNKGGEIVMAISKAFDTVN